MHDPHMPDGPDNPGNTGPSNNGGASGQPDMPPLYDRTDTGRQAGPPPNNAGYCPPPNGPYPPNGQAPPQGHYHPGGHYPPPSGHWQPYGGGYGYYYPADDLGDGLTEAEARAYVGENTGNAGYYVEKWSRYHFDRSFKGWNWLAFLFGLYWLIYRKMYGAALGTFALNFLIELALNGSGLSIVWNIAICAFFGYFGNRYYHSRAVNESLALRHLDDPNRHYQLAERGGTNVTALLICLLLQFLLWLATR